MNKIREKELEIMVRVCKENEISIKLMSELLKTAEKFVYETQSENIRKKEYSDLIDFYFKQV